VKQSKSDESNRTGVERGSGTFRAGSSCRAPAAGSSPAKGFGYRDVGGFGNGAGAARL
jgi:hypothetical protein